MTAALDADLAASLATLAKTALSLELGDDWIVFGGAAMALAGHDAPVPDIDVLAGPEIARRLVAALGGHETERTAGGPFRSRFLARCQATPVPIEVMVGLEVRDGDDWTPVAYATRVTHPLDGAELPTPEMTEQIAMARRFGRPKDLARAEALERLMQGSGA